VLVGDFLYSRAFQMMVDIGRMRVMQILADATNTIAAGEVMQLMNMHDPDVNEDSYRKVIYRKTARLFEAGAQIAAVLADQDANIESAMICYGQNLGTAFCAGLRRRTGGTRQKPRRRPGRGQADLTPYICNGELLRQREKNDSRRH
jgi:hypothetical protein